MSADRSFKAPWDIQELPAFSTFAPEEAGEPIYRVTNNRGRRVALCFDESIAQLVRIAPDLLVLAESIANDKVRVDGPFARVAIERLQVHARAILGAMKP